MEMTHFNNWNKKDWRVSVKKRYPRANLITYSWKVPTNYVFWAIAIICPIGYERNKIA
jgi:hypothetical protein